MPMALPLLAAGGSIFAGISAGGLIGGAMIAGGALSAVGAVTKNKKLAMIGGLVSLAGGVAGLASGAWSSAASGLAESSALEGFRTTELGATGATNAAMDAASAAAPTIAPAASAAAPTGIAAQGMQQAPALTNASAAAPTVDLAAAPTPSAAASGANPAQESFRTSELNAALKGGGDVSAWKTGVGDVSNWIRNNSTLVNTGAGIVGGAMRNASEQDMLKERLDQEQKALDRRRAQLSSSVVGLKMPTYSPPKG